MLKPIQNLNYQRSVFINTVQLLTFFLLIGSGGVGYLPEFVGIITCILLIGLNTMILILNWRKLIIRHIGMIGGFFYVLMIALNTFYFTIFVFNISCLSCP